MFHRPQRRRVTQPEGGRLMTKQEFKQECDIYNVLKNARRTGAIAHLEQRQPMFGDLPDPLDYQEAVGVLMRAEAAFAELPAAIRDSHGNDPQRFLERLADPNNAEEFRRMGILRPLPEVEREAPIAPVPPPVAGG